MASDPDVLQLLGRIDGKLDQVIEAAKEHRSDDQRRFADVYGRLDKQDADINKAKGAKGAIVWIVGLIAGGAGAIASHIIKMKSGG